MTIICPCGQKLKADSKYAGKKGKCPKCGAIHTFPGTSNESSTTAPFNFTSASPEHLKAEYSRIARESGDHRFFTRKELNHLPQILGDGEQVLAFSSGWMDKHTWLIVLTDRRILFLDKGLLYGLSQVAIELDKINAVTGTTGLVFGNILIQDGANERIIKFVTKWSVIPFTNKVRDALHALKD